MNAIVPTSPTSPVDRRISQKLRDAIDLMVFDGVTYDAAALKVGLTVRNMRMALERPHVLKYLRAQKQAMREAACAANVLRLPEEASRAGSTAQNAGIVIQIVNAPPPRERGGVTIDVEPKRDPLPRPLV
jgi:hypothetical protein